MYIPTPGLEIALQRWWSRWVLRGRRARPEFLMDGALSLRYTARYRATAAVTFAFFTGVYVLGYLDGDVFKTDTLKGVALTVGSALIWLLFAGFFVTSWLEQVVITPTQLRRRSWRGRQEVVWGEVNVFRIDHQEAQLKIGVEGGTVITVSLYLDGLNALADALQQHLRLPPDVLAGVLGRESTGAA